MVYSEDYKKLVDATALKDKYYEIDERVEEICKEAFKGCDKLEEIVMPKKLKKIDSEAFQGCSGLTELTLSNSLVSIGGNAFSWCSELTELTLPNSVTSIGGYAFRGCSGLEKIMVESGNSRYDSRDNCNSIIDTETNTLIVGCKNSVIPNGVTSIGDSAFGWCSELTELVLPNSVTSIVESAFAYCSGLEKITVESGNSRYDSRDNCNSIIETATNTLIAGCKNSIIPNSVTSIGDYAFEGCSSMTELTLPNSVRSIGIYAFKGCSGLTEQTLPNSVRSIGESAFDGCSGMTELTLPNSITSIGVGVFQGCSGMTELTLPNSITSIGDGAFAYCSGLAKIASLAGIPPMCGRKVFDGVNKTNCELIVPEGSVAAYKQAYGWNGFSNIRGFSE